MADFKWDDFPEADKFDWNNYEKDYSNENVSELESGARGLLQGATLGFSDEIVGAGQGIYDALTSDESLSDAYVKHRDESRKNNLVAQEVNPKSYMAGEIGGGIATSFMPVLGALNTAKGAKLATTVGKGMLQGGLQSTGSTIEDLASQKALEEIAMGTFVGGTLGAAGSGIANANVGKRFGQLGEWVSGQADDLYSKSTGATANQASKFKPGFEKELRKHVKFGDTAEDIANRLGAEVDRAGSSIGSILKELEANGVKANIGNVVDKLNSEIVSLSKDPSKAAQVRKLKTFLDDIVATGEMNVPITAAEETKKGFRKQAGNWLDPESGAAAKQTYLGYMDEVERAAKEANPALGNKFEEEKELFGLLSPIQEAAEKRALQQKQSQFGGLLDTAAVGTGGAVLGGPVGAIAGLIGKKYIAPRVTSSAAVSMDKLANILKATPEKFGKFLGVLQNAAQRGSNALGAAHFILQQKSPEYRQHLISMQEEEK